MIQYESPTGRFTGKQAMERKSVPGGQFEDFAFEDERAGAGKLLAILDAGMFAKRKDRTIAIERLNAQFRHAVMHTGSAFTTAVSGLDRGPPARRWGRTKRAASLSCSAVTASISSRAASALADLSMTMSARCPCTAAAPARREVSS